MTNGGHKMVDEKRERVYTGGAETNVTGAFCFSNAIANTIILLWAKRPVLVDSRPVIRLSNDGN